MNSRIKTRENENDSKSTGSGSGSGSGYSTGDVGHSLKHEEDIVYTENGSMMFNPYNEQNAEIT